MREGSPQRHSQRPTQARRRVERDVFPSFDEIAARAHQIFVHEGQKADGIFDCWRRAEHELLMQAALRIKS